MREDKKKNKQGHKYGFWNDTKKRGILMLEENFRYTAEKPSGTNRRDQSKKICLSLIESVFVIS